MKKETEMQQRISKTREYLNYIEEHYNNVQKAWQELQKKCKDMRFIYDDYVWGCIDVEVKVHDLSKLSECEFVQYRKAFYATKQEGKCDMSEAWEHHQKVNPHHWQNWTKCLGIGNPYQWEIHCVHMVIDWIAMGYKFNDTAQRYYEKNKDKINIPDYAVKFIYEIFKRITKDGE